MPRPEQATSAVTIFDVAQAAGVSYATVSRVLNNKAHVKPEKREAVLRAMTRLGYVVNQQAPGPIGDMPDQARSHRRAHSSETEESNSGHCVCAIGTIGGRSTRAMAFSVGKQARTSGS